MKKNVAGQFAPSVNLVSATDGSALTTAATIHVTLDNGTPAAGGGTLAYVANRGWSYAPTQAETNADKLTFFYGHASAVGGGVSATVYPSFPQTGDAYTRALNDLDAAGVRAALGLPAADLGTRLDDIPTVAEFEARTKPTADYFDPATDTVTVGANNDKTGYSLTNSPPTAAAIASTVWGQSSSLVLPNTFGSALSSIPGLINGLHDFDPSLESVSLTTTERTTLAAAIEGALLNEGDSQQFVDAMVQAIGNVNVDEAALVALIRADLERTGGDLKTLLANLADVPTVAEFEARTKLAADYFDPATDETNVGFWKGTKVTGLVTGIPGNFTAYPSVYVNGMATGLVRADVGLAAANLDTQLADIPTVAEFTARTKLAAEYATPANVTDSQAAIIAAIGTPMQADADVNLAAASLLTMLETDGLVSRFTANALEMAPVGGGGGDTTALEKLMRADVRTVVGVGGQYNIVWYDEADGVTELMRKDAIQPDGTALTAPTQVLGGLI